MGRDAFSSFENVRNIRLAILIKWRGDADDDRADALHQIVNLFLHVANLNNRVVRLGQLVADLQ